MTILSEELNVRVVYRDGKMEPVYEKEYTLEEYTAMLRADLLRLITDIEDLVYRMNDNKPKCDWSDDSWSGFCKIKHKMLDKAGDIGRLPENISKAVKDDGTSSVGAEGEHPIRIQE